MIRQPPRPPFFPSTTLSRSASPLELAVALQRARDGSLLATIERADWKSAHAEGNVSLRAGDHLPQGKAALRVARLEDLQDRKSTRLNSSHSQISYAVFCLKT